MKNEGWTTFSFAELLRPPDGWKTGNAILATYSADLVVIVTALLALAGCDLDHRRKGSRVELVKAVEALRGRVRILAQANRVALPKTSRPILKLLDRFLYPIITDETEHSWHPKMALVRYHRIDDATDYQWHIWLGSRNLTCAMNWDAGLLLASRADGKGQKIEGLAAVGAKLAKRARLESLSADDIGTELSALTWDCPPDCTLDQIRLFGPDLTKGFPTPHSDTERVIVVSPFLDSDTMQAIAKWGHLGTRRTLVSTSVELQRLCQNNKAVFKSFDKVLVQPFPDLTSEGADPLDEEASAAIETTEDEEPPPAGLHAKLYLATKGARRQLWIGSANATERGWQGRNFEVVSDLRIGRDAVEAIEDFVASCEQFKPNPALLNIDNDEKIVEDVRRTLSSKWLLRQQVGENEVQVVASEPPLITDSAVQIQIAALGGTWSVWPHGVSAITLSGLRHSQRSDFLQIRLSYRDRKCEWLQVAPCDPPPDEKRDHALIAQYLDPRTFLIWLRSVLADEPPRAGGGDWDADETKRGADGAETSSSPDVGLMPTVEEILRAWSRNPSAFISADEKINSYLSELERRAIESGHAEDVILLATFQRTWTTLASELR